MPGSGLVRAASILQPFPLLPLQTSKLIRSPPGPGLDHILALGDGETGTSSSTRPPPPAQAWVWPLHGPRWRLMGADVVC